MKRLLVMILGLALLLGACTTRNKPDGSTGSSDPAIGTEGRRTNEPAANKGKDDDKEPKPWSCPRCGQPGNKGERCSFCDKHK